MTDIPPTEPGTEADHQAGATPFDPGASSGLTKDQEVGHYIEMWKQAVAVQMHFNDIEWRIRGLALTVATFALGASGVAAKDGTRIWWFSLGSVIILIGLLLWYGFYFVDRIWYHPLLKAAVEQGTEIENEIKESLPRAGMTATITARSPQQRTRFIQRLTGKPPEMHSDDKLVRFYTIGASALIIAAAALQVGVLLGAEPAP